MNLLLFIIICYGMTNILVFGSIFNEMRTFIINKSKFFGDLIQCMMCSSFWVGAIVSYFVFSPTTTYDFTNGSISIFLDACLASGAVWVIHTIQEHFEK